MKVLKIFGVVVGIHVFALILIFANPGCSSTNKPMPAPSDTVAKNDEPPATVSVPSVGPDSASPVVAAAADSPVVSVPSAVDPNASSAAVVRFSPTRPDTAAAAALEAQPVADVTPATTYTVTRGDSLWTIAKKHHLTVSDLARANNIKEAGTVRLGQKLIIPGKPAAGGSAAVAATSVAKAPVGEKPATPGRGSGETVKHVVKPGETLGAIARKYQVKVGEIATANNISDPAKIRPGMELTIPGWRAPAGKTNKSAATHPASDANQPPSTPPPAQPAPDQDLDSGLKPSAGEPPVIKVEDGAGPTKA